MIRLDYMTLKLRKKKKKASLSKKMKMISSVWKVSQARSSPPGRSS